MDEVLGLQEGQDELHKRWRENYKAGGIDRFTFKERIGEEPEDSDKDVYYKPGKDAEKENEQDTGSTKS